jgi:hypothetical protein
MNDPKGIWNIHIGWISYRCFLDHNEVVIHHALWRNPKDFNRSPFLIMFKELSVSFDLFELIELIRTGKDIIFDQIVLDGVEIYFERMDDSIAVLSRPHSSSKPATVSPTAATTPTLGEQDQQPMEGHNTLNVWAAIGCESLEDEERMFSGLLRGIYNDIVTKIRHKLAKPFQKRPHTRKINPNDEEEDFNNETVLIDRKRAESNAPEVVTPPPPGMPTFVMNRLFIIDLLGHPLDLLSGKHMEPRKHCDVYIDLFYLTKVDVTGKPYYSGEARRILSAKRFGQLFGEQFADVLFQKCGTEIANIIMETSANRAAANLRNLAHEIKEMIPRIGCTNEANKELNAS